MANCMLDSIPTEQDLEDPWDTLIGEVVVVANTPVGLMLVYNDGRTILVSVEQGELTFEEAGVPEC